jgi:predicted nucleic acid-binding protein
LSLTDVVDCSLVEAAYIALAEALGCELLTGDVKIKNAAGHHATVTLTR